jgi:tRNA(Arg) A34 adenosine deaminase TadA
MGMTLSATDELNLRRAVAASQRAVDNGNMPFGGVFADADGNVLVEGENTSFTEKDPTAHAETNLVRLVVRQLTPEQIADGTLYTSCEPCAMCSGAMYWGGINRMVYAMSEADLLTLTGDHEDNPTMDGVGCRAILNSGPRDVEVLGGYLIEEAMEVQRAFWTDRPSG